MSNRKTRKLTILSKQQLTPNMLRISFQADDLSDFPVDSEGGYLKLFFSPDGGTDVTSLPEGEKPKMRTYSISQFRPQQHQFDVDFVSHEVGEIGGFASRWSESAVVGDTIYGSTPGLVKPVNADSDWCFLVADMTALPALTAQLTKLPATATGYAIIEVRHVDDKQDIAKPAGVEIFWQVASELRESSLVESVTTLPWFAGEASVWCACEFSQMRALRDYFRNTHAVDKDNLYISSYWKSGCTEDGHKIVKREDVLAQEQLV